MTNPTKLLCGNLYQTAFWQFRPDSFVAISTRLLCSHFYQIAWPYFRYFVAVITHFPSWLKHVEINCCSLATAHQCLTMPVIPWTHSCMTSETSSPRFQLWQKQNKNKTMLHHSKYLVAPASTRHAFCDRAMPYVSHSCCPHSTRVPPLTQFSFLPSFHSVNSTKLCLHVPNSDQREHPLLFAVRRVTKCLSSLVTMRRWSLFITKLFYFFQKEDNNNINLCGSPGRE